METGFQAGRRGHKPLPIGLRAAGNLVAVQVALVQIIISTLTSPYKEAVEENFFSPLPLFHLSPPHLAQTVLQPSRHGSDRRLHGRKRG